ncbi:MAG TPA: hypothetical protein PLF13_11800 [candidate division Zixibacteria bacterium]|nr:hypothetical protein [candidate division Zixibacteria bacterium]
MSEYLFFSHYGADPYFNMAFDEYLFSRASKNPGSIYLRLYTWRPGALTFGRNQRLEKAFNHSALGDTPAIRRITGGRALYHDPSELTYCITVNQDASIPSVLENTGAKLGDRIAEGLVAFLLEAGIDSDYVRQSSKRHADRNFFHTAPCFASRARSEIVATSGKIVASAAYRSGSTILQHGSIKIGGIVSHPALTGVGDGSKSKVVTSAEFASAAERFRQCLGKHFVVAFDHGDIAPEDFQALKKRRETIYRYPFSTRDKF